MLIQIVFLIVLLAALAMTWRRAQQGAVTRVEAGVWSLMWIGAGIIVLSPQTATFVANRFGVGRGSDFIVYAAVIVLFVLVFRIFVTIHRLERHISDMVRADALKDLPPKHESDS